MAIAVGSHLGPYLIVSLIGSGGMGEVYRASDTRLKRDVALKVLPEAFGRDQERMARFQREAEMLASLNHPNIAAIYGVEDRALVMELVQGSTLSGPLPVETALNYARQIAEALEAAHEKTIIHRDLKPANVMVTPEGVVKILDFGLAKAADDFGGASDLSNSPTLTMSPTSAGVILGTAAYMSPEQAHGKIADRRADIWAFGAVLYEMLSGKQAFSGESVSDTLASVLKLEPDWNAVPADIPSAIHTLIRRCLTKDRKQRLQAIGEARITIEECLADPTKTSTPTPDQDKRSRHTRNMLWFAPVAIFVLAAAAIWSLWPAKPSVPEFVRRFNIQMPEKVSFGATLRMSPDGRYVVFRGFGDGGSRLWLRALDTLETRPLLGTEGVGVQNSAFWSPDSRTIVFGTQNALMKVSVSGGPPIKICEIPASMNVGFWTADNRIVFGTTSGIFEVPAGGGTLKPLTELAGGETQHAPQGLLPDGKHFIYLVRGTSANAGVNVRALDDKPGAAGRRLLPDDTSALFGAAKDHRKPGWMVFVREGVLLAQRFDPKRLELVGDPVPIATSNGNLGGFSLSETGDLVYTNASQGIRQLDWYDRKGNRVETAWKERAFNEIELSPDGTRVAAGDYNYPPPASIWVHEFARKSETQITTSGVHPVWSQDGQRLVWADIRKGDLKFYTRAANAADAEQLFAEVGKTNTYPVSWSRDGRFILFETSRGKTGRDLMVLPIDRRKTGMPSPYLNGEGNEGSAQFSPTGSHVAYVGVTGGRSEVYVSTFPNPAAGKWTISAGGGYQPRWRRDGKELFYFTGDGKLMSVEVKPGPSFGIPKELFQPPIYGGGATAGQIRWDVSPDGQKFLINTAIGDTGTALTVILNWQAGL